MQSMYISRLARCVPKSKMRTRPPLVCLCVVCMPAQIKAVRLAVPQLKAFCLCDLNRVGVNPDIHAILAYLT